MEEKKTLWIVLLVSFFVLVVFGSAMLLYHQPKNEDVASSEELKYLKEIAEAPASEKVDPDLWSRELEKVPDYEDNEGANSIDRKKSITFVDGTSVENGKSYIERAYFDVWIFSCGLREERLPAPDVPLY